MVTAGAAQPRPRRRRAAFIAGSHVLLVPAAIALAAVSVYPLAYGIVASLRQYRYGLDMGFAGADNYLNVLQDATFLTALGTTAKYVVLPTAFRW